MVDFRKWFLAFAVVAILAGFAVSASAQTPAAFGCSVNQGVPPTVRAEGITELVGDIVLTCTGGTPTAAGAVVPQANISVTLNTNITSRLLSDPWTEALLMVDEPSSPSNPTVAQAVCGATGTPDNINASGPGVCIILGTGTGVGTYNPAVASAATPLNSGRPNVFQGRTSPSGPNQLVWLGIPFDPPGTANSRIIRITNIRANASQLGVSATLIPSQIAAYVSITASTSIPVTNPNITVAFVQKGLIVGNTTKTLQQCNDFKGTAFSLTYNEGFPSAFKPRNTNVSNTTSPPPTAQAVPGAVYNTETGFYNPAFPSLSRGNLGVAGLADAGTRLRAVFNNVGAGIKISVPVIVNVTRISDSATTGAARLVSTDANGAGPYTAIAGSGGMAALTVTSGSASAFYEILNDDPFNFETVVIPVTLAWTSNTQTGVPGLGTSTVRQSFAPISTVTTADASSPIPRFIDSGADKSAHTIIQCVCNLLFPFVTNQSGFDTGVAIANTTLDPFSTPIQTGTVALYYYGGTAGGGAAPATQTSQAVTGGQILTFTLSSGGNFGIAATPSFQGYIIATANFQYCHGFAYISDLGAQKLAEGYLALVLDKPTLNRTLQDGENEGQ